MSFNAGGYVTDTDLLSLLKLSLPWTPYTPAWTTSGTAPVLGNGTIDGEYLISGKLYIGRMRLLWGSTTVGGVGSWNFGLGGGAVMSTTGQAVGSLLMRDNSAALHFMGASYQSATTSFEVRCHGANVAAAAVPFTWAVNDFLATTIFAELT